MFDSSVHPLRNPARALTRWVAHCIHKAEGLGAFALITLGVLLTKSHWSSRVIRPLLIEQIHRCGVRQLPGIFFIAFSMGFVVIGQTIPLLTLVGADGLAGTLMVTVTVREIAPLATALLLLSRVGTVTVIELATGRAVGEVDALEALGIDPIHYLVVPRAVGLGLSVFGLTVYFILFTLAGGYLFLFLTDVPISPLDYIRQLASALIWLDFVFLTMKTLLFGAIIAVVTGHAGLARPMQLEDISHAATSATMVCVLLFVGLDVLFMIYLSIL